MIDLHIHIRDGINNEEELQKFIEIGRKSNIDTFCFLEHGNRISSDHYGYLNNFEAIDELKNAINNIKGKNKDVTIFSGIEIDYSMDLDFRNRTLELLKYGNFDIVIGSIHHYKFDDGRKYFECIIDMINNYPINVIGHIKLRDNWKDYLDVLEIIVKECSNKKIRIELNTSDRSIWNQEQFDYMMNLFEKYNLNYTCGSDAHKCTEVGQNYKVLKKRLEERGKL